MFGIVITIVIVLLFDSVLLIPLFLSGSSVWNVDSIMLLGFLFVVESLG